MNSAAAAGRRDFETFYRREYGSLLAMAYALTGSMPTAEDLVQEAFIRAHRDWDRVAGFDQPTWWIRRVVANLSMSHLRRVAAESSALVRLARRSGQSQPADQSQVEFFWELVRGLPKRQAQVVALHYVDDRSITEIAEILECAPGTVKAHLHKARATLARRLGVAEEE